jgi:hypothetical protein
VERVPVLQPRVGHVAGVGPGQADLEPMLWF